MLGSLGSRVCEPLGLALFEFRGLGLRVWGLGFRLRD